MILELEMKAIRRYREDFTITEKAPTMAFPLLKAPTGAFTFKTLLRHYAQWTLTPREILVNLRIAFTSSSSIIPTNILNSYIFSLSAAIALIMI